MSGTLEVATNALPHYDIVLQTDAVCREYQGSGVMFSTKEVEIGLVQCA